MRTLHRIILAAILMLGGVASPAAAKVAETRDNGFVTQSVVVVDTDIDKTWATLSRIGDWWDPAHSFFGSDGAMAIDMKAGGCFCETGKGGEFAGSSVQHARVIHVDGPNVLRLSGALGPLQSEAVTGTLTITLAEAEDAKGTRIIFTYVVGGYMRFPVTTIAPLVDRVMATQIVRLASLAETGSAEPGANAKEAIDAASGAPAPADEADTGGERPRG